jgi:calcium/calmodulin-dependent protein kinase I
MERVSDLVTDSKLEIDVFDNYTVQTSYISDPRKGQRRARVQQKWQRLNELGRGSFGVVWLEKCAAGPDQGQLRAVKEVRKEAANVAPNYYRELEAISKFSQERVG